MGSDIEHDEMLGAGEWDADEIARCALAAYRAQPARGKPGNSTSTPSEHTVLAAFVLFTPSSCPATDTAARRYRCLSFATGTSALPRKALDLACGDVLHDSHAEVLARRALLRWLYLQLLTRSHLGTSDYGSELEGGEEGKRPEPLLERSEQQGQGAKWTLRNGCKLILSNWYDVLRLDGVVVGDQALERARGWTDDERERVRLDVDRALNRGSAPQRLQTRWTTVPFEHERHAVDHRDVVACQTSVV